MATGIHQQILLGLECDYVYKIYAPCTIFLLFLFVSSGNCKLSPQINRLKLEFDVQNNLPLSDKGFRKIHSCRYNSPDGL